jgi:RNA polymerase sigma-70 factor, ECF subfamily
MANAGQVDQRSDEELVRLCNTGDAVEAARAFEVLYGRHKDYVIRVAMRYVRDRDVALDVLQETFRYLLGKFPPSGEGLVLGARLTTLLYPVAKNTALNLLRKAERFPSAGDMEPDDVGQPAAAESADVAGLLRGLSEERREVILMRFVDGLSLQEIAAALEIPLGTVKSRLHLAIKQLRESPEIRDLHFP